MKEKTSSFRPSIGGALIVVMFVILCIVTFATLSLVSANAEYKLSEKTASRTTEYYNACNYAEELLSQADAAIASAHRSAGPQDYAAQLSGNLEPLGITVTADGAEHYAAYAVKVSDTQNLVVRLRLSPYGQVVQGYVTVTEWRLVSSADWEPEQHIKLLDANPETREET